MNDSPASVAAIYRYPVKGLSPEALGSARIEAGGALPFDRAFAIENGRSGFDPAAPRYFPKIAFLMLMRNERLAGLATVFDDRTGTLTIRRGGAIVATGDLATLEGRQAVEAFFDAFEADELRGPAKVLAAPAHSFADAGEHLVSLINLASVRDLERHTDRPLNPLRFRGNLHVEGLSAWEELDWVGRRIAVGPVLFDVVQPIERCAATNVDPDTAERDLAIPRTLLEVYGHAHCGIYLRALSSGEIRLGDAVAPTA